MSTSENKPDVMEECQGALIQHGPLNRRIYLMKLGDADPAELLPALEKLVRKHGYTKIFAKVPASKAAPFLSAQFHQEASIPGFFNGKEEALFLGKYFDPERAVEKTAEELDGVIELAKKKGNAGKKKQSLLEGAILRQCTEQDAQVMARIYAEVFPSYPFPITEPDYLIETMRTHIVYYGIEVQGQLVALSSAEMDEKASNVEMTDFATLPKWLGHGFAVHLLSQMEVDMVVRGINTAYTIARSVSPGMNITFAKLGYQFGGRLKNNTNISGNIESMNIWYK